MHQAVRRLTVRRCLTALLLAGSLVALGFGALPGPDAEAAAGGWICEYYSDATHTHQVGARGVGCCGESLDWGVTSPHEVCGAYNCVTCPEVS